MSLNVLCCSFHIFLATPFQSPYSQTQWKDVCFCTLPLMTLLMCVKILLEKCWWELWQRLRVGQRGRFQLAFHNCRPPLPSSSPLVLISPRIKRLTMLPRYYSGSKNSEAGLRKWRWVRRQWGTRAEQDIGLELGSFALFFEIFDVIEIFIIVITNTHVSSWAALFQSWSEMGALECNPD